MTSLAPGLWLDARVVASVRPNESTDCLVVVDEALTDAPVLHRLEDALFAAGRSTRTLPLPPRATIEQALLLADVLASTPLVVAVGGGSVIDLVAIARAATNDDLRRRITSPQRSGAVMLPASATPAPRFIAVPTTVGTGAESSGIATVVVDGRRRLVIGPCMRPDAAVIDPLATASEPAPVRRGGILEIYLRLAGPYLASRDGDAVSDPLRIASARALLALDPARPESAIDIARISALSHSPLLALRDAPFGVRTWFLCTDLAQALGVPKTTVLGAIAPAIWARIADGDERWGNAQRLREFWSRTAGSSEGDDPADGLRTLAVQWGVASIPASLAKDLDIDALAESTARAWGWGLPMLRSLRPRDIADVYRDVLNPRHRAHPAAAGARADLRPVAHGVDSWTRTTERGEDE